MTEQRMNFSAPESVLDSAEETARADLYGLLATLFHQPPDAALLHRIAAAPQQSDLTSADQASRLAQAWNALAGAAATTTEVAAAEAFRQLFVGVGKPDVFLNGSYYIAGFLNEQPLVRLRDDLQALGLERAGDQVETEDHIAMLCEVMRYLIAAADPVQGSLANQQQFYRSHLQPFAVQLCDVIAAHPHAGFYASVAHFAREFFEIETLAFDMA